ncbi:hypothetical protein V8C26DRAFT_115501 [Trichoderma gracile]
MSIKLSPVPCQAPSSNLHISITQLMPGESVLAPIQKGACEKLASEATALLTILPAQTLTPDIPPVLVWPVLPVRSRLSSIVPTYLSSLQLCLVLPFRFPLVRKPVQAPCLAGFLAHIQRPGPQSYLECGYIQPKISDAQSQVIGLPYNPSHPSTWYIASMPIIHHITLPRSPNPRPPVYNPLHHRLLEGGPFSYLRAKDHRS